MRKLFIAITTVMSLMSASAEVTYKYDKSTKTLTISGDGITNETVSTDMWDEDYVSAPWSSLNEEAEKVIINEGITGIGNHAFISFGSLKEVKLPSTIESIGEAAFEECKALTDINLPEGLKSFGQECFWGCESLTSISIPKSVTSLPDEMFKNCTSLETIDLGGVKEFGKDAFASCAFSTFVIPEGTKTISENMFFSCKNIKTIDIPASVESIKSGAFYYCVLDTINYLGETFPSITGINNYTSGSYETHITVHRINCNAYSADAVDAIKGHGGNYDSEIIPSWPNGTKVSTSSNAKGPLTITPVDCENQIYKLSVDLWSSNYQVTWEGTYDVPEDQLHSTEIEVDLSSPATILAQIDYVPGEGSGGDSGSSIISFSVTKVGMGHVKVEEIEKTETSQTYKLVAIPEEGYEFLYWETYNDILTEEQETNPEIEITITESDYVQAHFTPSPYCGIDGGENIVWSVENDTLYLTGEGEMENYNGLDNAPYVWSDDEFSVVKVGEGITSLGTMAFVFMEDIEKVYLPSTLTNIGDYAFTYCGALEKIYFAGSTPPSSYGTNIFAETSEDLQLVVPCGSEDTYKEAFADYSLENVNTGESEPVELDIVCQAGDDEEDDEEDDDDNEEDDDDNDGDSELPSLDEFTFNPENVCGAEGDGSNILWAYDEETKTLALKGTGKMQDYGTRSKRGWKNLDVKNLIVSEGITTIGERAFFEQSSLENVYLPSTIDSILYYAFASTSSMKKVVLSEGVKVLYDNSFYGTGLTEITFPSTLQSIGNYAFQYCQFTSVVIPESVTFIGHGAFYNSGTLESVVFESETPAETGEGYTIVTTAGNTIGHVVKLIVPCDAVEAYKEHSGYQAEYVQGEFPYTLTLSQTTDTYAGSDLGGKPQIQQWPDCETGEAIVSVYVKQPYKFSHWEATGVTLTEEQAKSETITFVVDADCVLTAFFKDITSVEDVDADDIVVTVSDSRISVNRDEFQILDVLGRDVTSANGSLTTGVYVVKVNGQTFKAVVK